jgi:hypothetical protein
MFPTCREKETPCLTPSGDHGSIFIVDTDERKQTEAFIADTRQGE